MRRVLLLAVSVLLLALGGCMLPGPRFGPGPSLRLSEVAMEGDATRRASLRLVMDGLDAEIDGDTGRALGLYARALQIDSGNPYAYLALARQHASAGEPARTLEHLVRFEDLLTPDELDSPRVAVHRAGLRGIALRLDGRDAEADRLLERAARAAPSVWSDGRLTAAELR